MVSICLSFSHVSLDGIFVTKTYGFILALRNSRILLWCEKFFESWVMVNHLLQISYILICNNQIVTKFQKMTDWKTCFSKNDRLKNMLSLKHEAMPWT